MEINKKKYNIFGKQKSLSFDINVLTLFNYFIRDDVNRLFVCARGAGVSGALSGSIHGLEGST